MTIPESDLNELDLNFDLNLDDFDLDFASPEKIDTRYCKPKRTKSIPDKLVKYEYAEKLAKDVDLHGRTFVVVNGTFIFGDFIEALIVSNNIKVKEMTISTLSMSENNVDSLAGLLKRGYVDKLNLIVSDYFFSHERRNLIEYLYEECDIDNKFQLAVTRSHCKTCIFETYNDNYITIHGSANLRSSDNLEQIMIENDKELYLFNYSYQMAIVDRFKTINKTVRGKELWKIINK